MEVYNDINNDAVNFLLVLREDAKRLQEACASLPYSRYLFETWQDELFEQRRGGGTMNDFDRAVKFFYVNRGGINSGGLNHKSGWKHSAHHNTPGVYRQVCKRIREFGNRLQDVFIECRDFKDVIMTYDSKDTVFYVDPPYVGTESRYTGGFRENDHRYLSALLNRIQGKAIVSYYEHELIDVLYDGWQRIMIETKKNTVTTGETFSRPNATELLLTNFDHGQMSIFDFHEGGEGRDDKGAAASNGRTTIRA